MRLPRDVGGMELAGKLERFGYQVTRQTGSHIRLTTEQEGEHHVTIPRLFAGGNVEFDPKRSFKSFGHKPRSITREPFLIVSTSPQHPCSQAPMPPNSRTP